ncbi:MAG: hypothetical protein RIS44_1243 [Pseudomonadota bacterium]|jgi:CheY-like chemotaxis protein
MSLIPTIVYNLFLVGFSSYEKSTTEAFFRLAARRAPHWGMAARAQDARVIIISAASGQDFDSFLATVAPGQRVIIVGDSDFGSGWPVVSRPIKLTAVLALLNTAVDPKTSETLRPAVAAPEAPAALAVPNVMRPLASPAAPSPVPAMRPNAVAMHVTQTSAPVPLSAAPSYTASPNAIEQLMKAEADTGTGTRRVLLVDDSDVALKYMHNRMRHFGYECELVRCGEAALAMVATKSYEFVFLDVMMAGLDGYQTCKAIKANKARVGPAPVVVMLTSRGGTIDKIRGTMAGCDAYLTKPLNDSKLAAVLTKFDDPAAVQRPVTPSASQPVQNIYSPRSQ